MEVRMEGGSFHVRVSEDLDVVLRGPVEEVASGELADGFVRSLTNMGGGDR
jgi:diaminopimelate epimerase